MCSSPLDRGPSSSSFCGVDVKKVFLSSVNSIECYLCRRYLFGRLHRDGYFAVGYVRECFRVMNTVIENETCCCLGVGNKLRSPGLLRRPRFQAQLDHYVLDTHLLFRLCCRCDRDISKSEVCITGT